MTFEKRQDKNQEKYCEESKREEKLRRYLKFGNYYIKKNVHMHIRSWCHICWQEHVEYFIKNDEREFIKIISSLVLTCLNFTDLHLGQPSIINPKLEIFNGVEMMWKHNNLSFKI